MSARGRYTLVAHDAAGTSARRCCVSLQMQERSPTPRVLHEPCRWPVVAGGVEELAVGYIVVIRGSIGAREPSAWIVATFPRDSAAAVVGVVYSAPRGPGYLAELRPNCGAKYPAGGEAFAGVNAPPDHRASPEASRRRAIRRYPRASRDRPAAAIGCARLRLAHRYRSVAARKRSMPMTHLAEHRPPI